MTHWSVPFVGMPWKVRGRAVDGVDCWGLCWLAWRANGIDAPSYGDDYVDDREAKEIADLIGNKSVSGPWQIVQRGQERDFDLLTFRVGGFESHVGMVTGRNTMLHIPVNGTSHIARYDDGRWFRRLTNIYRYIG